MTGNKMAEVCTYLESTQSQLLSELNSLDLNYYPPDGGWSAGQIIAHLTKTERYLYPLFSFVPRLIRSQKMLDKFDWLNIALNKFAGMSFLSLGDQLPKDLSKTDMSKLRGRFTAPAFLKPSRKHYDLKSLLQKREAARAKTLAALYRSDFSRLTQLRFSHPILGSFTLLEFVMFIGKHEEWHTQQLKRIKATLATT